jgi:hypothetical protein
MKASSIYKLNRILDNPIFEGFAVGDQPSLLGRGDVLDDFFPAKREEWNWQPEKLGPVWKPLKVAGRVAPFNDFPCLSLMVPVFSERAVTILEPHLTKNGELLPLISEIGNFYAYNCTTVVEILDQEKCKGHFMHPGRLSCAVNIDYFAVRENLISDLTIFRMRELCNCVFVTNVFVDVVTNAGLNGFDFRKIWPLPEGSDYFKEHRAKEIELQKVNVNGRFISVKQESVIIELRLSEQKITKEERRKLARLADELDAQLVIRHIDEAYFGSLEGRKTNKGVCRMYLSCPDARRLIQKLKPWFQSIEWSSSPRILLRSVPYDDSSQEGEVISDFVK